MALNSKYRAMSSETLAALRSSFLLQIKQIEAVGQSHGISGRSHGAATLATLTQELTDVESAINFLANPANAGNIGWSSRYGAVRPYSE